MNPASLPPFFLYARKSTDVEDMQVLSIESQLAELREYAARENISIVEELVEKQSAKIPGRPIFNGMIDRIEKGEASGIVSWHPDRLARNSVDGGKLIYLVDTGKIKSLKFPQFWFESTPQGKFMLTIAFGQSKYFVDSLAENTRRGLRQKVRRGEFPGFAPPGYLNDSRTKTIVVDHRHAPIVRQMFEKFATGRYTFWDMAVFLSQHGITTRGGKTMRDKASWMLANPFYYGHFRYAGEIHEGTHEPLIAKKLFDAVQEVWKRRSHSWHDQRPVKPFLGLFRCGECGMMVTAEYKTKFYPTTNHHATYVYYRCTKKSKDHICHQPFIREEALDRQLSTMLQTVSLPKDWAAKMSEKLEAEKADAAHSSHAYVAEKQKEISTITGKLQRLLDSYLDQDIDKEEYRSRKAKLLSDKKTLEESLSRLQHTQTAWLEPMRQWVKEASEIPEIARGEDKQAKKVLAQKIFGSNLTLTHHQARGDAREPWAALCAAPTSRKLERDTGIGIVKAALNLPKFLLNKDTELEAAGVLGKDIIQDRSLNAVKKFWEVADKEGFFRLFDLAEKWNRGVAYWGAKAQGVRRGMSEPQAIEFAKKIVAKTQFLYDAIDTPVALQSDLIKTVFQFAKYPVAQSEFLLEMVKRKDIVGSIRWVASSLLFIATVGKLYGADWKEILPRFRFGAPPTLQLPYEAGKAAFNVPNKYGTVSKEQNPLLRMVQSPGVQKGALNYFPAGAQIKKTYEGLTSYNAGESKTPTGTMRFPVEQSTSNLLRSILFGQYSTPEAQTYFDTNARPLSEKQSQDVRTGVKTYPEILQEREDNAQVRATKEQVKQTGKPTIKGSQVYYPKADGSVTMVDISYTPPSPKLTGNATIDKKNLTAYKAALTSQKNKLIDLAQSGLVDMNQVSGQINTLQSTRNALGSASSSGGTVAVKKISIPTMKAPAIKRLSSPKFIKIKGAKVPVYTKLKFKSTAMKPKLIKLKKIKFTVPKSALAQARSSSFKKLA